MIYASTFTSGTEKYVKPLLSKRHTSIKILSTLDGLIIYTCDLEPKNIAKLRFFTNSFIVISDYEKSSALGFNTLVRQELSSNNIEKFTNAYFRTPAKFRIVFMDKNTPASVSGELRQSLENKILKNKNLTVNRVIPDSEFWFMKRSEHVAFFLYRITYHPSAEKLYRKGELHKEICQILNIAAEPKKTDILLDPFCGYGAIGLERLHFGECGKIICVDSDGSKTAVVQHKASHSAHPSYFEIHNRDFFSMNIANESIDKVVTDPPWGDFSQISDIEEFYNRLLTKLQKIVKAGGIIVILTSKKLELEKQLETKNKLHLTEKLDILVSGKKAAIYKIIRSKGE